MRSTSRVAARRRAPGIGAIAVLPIASRHIGGFRACLDAVARERRHLAMTEAPLPRAVRAFVREGLKGGAVRVVALDGGRVVGWADILASFGQACAHCGRLGIGVLAAYRGRGIGRRLLRACLARAREAGFTRIELDVRADNAAAIRLYKRFGFVREARKRNALRFDGVYFDAVQMSLVSAKGASGRGAP